MKAQGPGMQYLINSLLGNGIKITMLMKDAIITSKLIFLPGNFDHEKQVENRE